MFSIVQKPKDTECAARRCKNKPHAHLPDQGLHLCHKHHSQWIEAGSPDLRDPGESLGTVPDGLVPDLTLETTLTAELADVRTALDMVAGLPSDTDAALAVLTQAQAQASARRKELEEERKSVTGPLNKVIRQVNGWFSPVRDGYDTLARALSGRLVEAKRAAEQVQDAACAQIEAAGGVVDETTIIAHQTPDIDLPPGVGRDVPAYRITDESQLVREMLSPDPVKIRAIAAEALKQGITAGQGVEFFYKSSGT